MRPAVFPPAGFRVFAWAGRTCTTAPSPGNRGDRAGGGNVHAWDPASRLLQKDEANNVLSVRLPLDPSRRVVETLP